MTPELREYFEIKGEEGVLVVRVEAESPALEADIRVGDVIVGVDGTPVRRPRDLRRLVGRAPEDTALAIELVREGDRREVQVALAEREDWSWRGHPRDLLPELFPHGPDPEIFSPDLDQTLRLLRERIRELERRIDELEQRLGPPQSGPDRT
jgi:hypothetical protein